MKNFIKKFKELDGTNKGILILSIIVTVLLILNLYMTIDHIMDYEKNKQSGNARWVQFSDMIQGYENKIDILEKEIFDMKNSK